MLLFVNSNQDANVQRPTAARICGCAASRHHVDIIGHGDSWSVPLLVPVHHTPSQTGTDTSIPHRRSRSLPGAGTVARPPSGHAPWCGCGHGPPKAPPACPSPARASLLQVSPPARPHPHRSLSLPLGLAPACSHAGQVCPACHVPRPVSSLRSEV